ncbi:MAG: ABC transporter ATP-binding protein [Alphaproteobacteria bacterium]|nr:ABC transporter ATP-binding protein [Alphaproteobacteria bacterium]NCQ87391.1 ABC transporter ATP-binding protein [Alphaproteobacteria bacterium]NCT06262.1 ABC transporter ATP-binding protein [Alphaproteobacteria bacterium]
MTQAAISIKNLEKTYDNGFKALSGVNLDVRAGEIFALLGPNGAGKTTLIGAVCGIVRATGGSVEVFGHDNIADYKAARSYIGLVPQELTTDLFETVWNTVSFSRELFGKPANPSMIEDILKRLSLWDKKDSEIRTLSGGMKRRVMIAKALSHEPRILFLDEPSAGVDVELRTSMWQQVHSLKDIGVTIILTTHYIEEAEEMADRVGIISKGNIILVDEKDALMKKMGNKQVVFDLREPLKAIPKTLSQYNLVLENDGNKLVFTYSPFEQGNDISNVLDNLKENGIRPIDIQVHQSSLEEIFIGLLNEKNVKDQVA